LLFRFTPLSGLTLETAWFYEIYASIFAGIGGMPRHTLILLLVCALFYLWQRGRWRKAI
jgi:hypothetical protein